ncbi:hypothetical protein EVAR_40674_1 [Eumeta japonica]|uniref:Uncharacterized protein n=1 Tax=Eumeta variegata TaxID=151549 RepID=A0A4C1X6Y5_EUMVA|nr:hypothetical protein EVAR_40674_1 [Eumeta japonica]
MTILINQLLGCRPRFFPRLGFVVSFNNSLASRVGAAAGGALRPRRTPCRTGGTGSRRGSLMLPEFGCSEKFAETISNEAFCASLRNARLTPRRLPKYYVTRAVS